MGKIGRCKKFCVWSELSYRVEAWMLKAQSIKRLEAFEMWLCDRRILVKFLMKLKLMNRQSKKNSHTQFGIVAIIV